MKHFLFATSVALSMTLAGCQAPMQKKQNSDPAASGAESQQQEPRVKTLAAPAHCGLTAPGLVLAQSREDWQRLTGKPTAQLPKWPQSDNTWLLVVSTGRKNTGGFSLSLDNFEWSDQSLRLNVTQHKPEAGVVTTQALTTPCLVLSVPVDGWSSLTVAGESPFPIIRIHP